MTGRTDVDKLVRTNKENRRARRRGRDRYNEQCESLVEPIDKSPVAVISRVLAWIAGFLILASALAVSIDVVTRSILKLTFLYSFELSSYAFAAAVTLGLAYTLISRAHIRIEVVYVLLKAPLRTGLDLIAIFALAAAAIAFAWFAAQTVLYTWEVNAHSNTALAVPLVLPQALWLAGLVWFAITACWLTARSVRHLLKGQQSRISAEIGVLSLQDELEDIPLEEAAAEAPPEAPPVRAVSHG